MNNQSNMIDGLLLTINVKSTFVTNNVDFVWITKLVDVQDQMKAKLPSHVLIVFLSI